MDSFLKSLVDELEHLEQLQRVLEERMKMLPQGCLVIVKKTGGAQYYHKFYSEGQSVRRYIPVGDHELARRLAQKGYDEAAMRQISWKLTHLRPLVEVFRAEDIDDLYCRLIPQRRNLVTPVQPTWEQVREKWLSQTYPTMPFRSDDHVILTERGERVRSKSEKILADHLSLRGIPYLYEKPLMLKDGTCVHPDFTLLSPRTRQEIFWEHAGMMDDANYAANFIRKLRSYENAGLSQRTNLVVTFELSNLPISMKEIDSKLHLYGLLP